MLKLSPIRYCANLTDFITYKGKSKNTGMYIYKMADRNGHLVGEMRAYPEVIYDQYRRFSPDIDSYHSFFIDRLFAHKKRIGVGTAFINIAKKESQRHFCLGNVHTIASSVYDKNNPPYIFFRKQGFNFSKYNKITQQIVDDCIKNNLPINKTTQLCHGDIPMYIVQNLDPTGELIEKYFRMRIRFPEYIAGGIK